MTGKDYATVVTTQEKLLTLTSLHQLVDQLLHPQFLRVHKSYLVALDKIRVVERQRIYTDWPWLKVWYKDTVMASKR